MKRLIGAFVALSMLLTLGACTKKDEKEKQPEAKGVNVEVYTVSTDRIEDTVTYTGEIKAGESVSVSSKVSARAAQVVVSEGDYVQAGDVLATLDKTDAELSLRQAQASYNSACANYNMTKNSTAMRNTTQANQNLEAAKIAYNTALSNYKREEEIYNRNSNVILAQQKYDDAKSSYERTKQLNDNDTNLISARNTYQTAADNYDRYLVLYEKGGVSELELENARTAKENAKAALDTVEANSQSGMEAAYSAMVGAEESLKSVEITAGASFEAAKSALANAKNTLDAARENVTITSVSNSDSIKTALAAVESAKAGLDIANNNVNNTTIKAPICGYISTKNINAGQMVAAGTEIFSIKNSGFVDAEIEVTESVIKDVYVGTPAIVSIKSSDIEDIEGTVTNVNPVKNDRTGMYSVKVSIDNADDLLKVGMFAEITLVLEQQENAVTIPIDAIVEDGEKTYVYVANGNEAKKAAVITGIEEDGMIQIINGIKENDRVIVAGKDYLSETNNLINITKEY